MVMDYNNTARTEATEKIVKGTEELQQSILDNDHMHDAEEFLKNKDINIDEYISHSHNMEGDVTHADDKSSETKGSDTENAKDKSTTTDAEQSSLESKATDKATSAK